MAWGYGTTTQDASAYEGQLPDLDTGFIAEISSKPSKTAIKMAANTTFKIGLEKRMADALSRSNVSQLADVEYQVSMAPFMTGRRAVLDFDPTKYHQVQTKKDLPVGLSGINDDLWALQHKVGLLGIHKMEGTGSTSLERVWEGMNVSKRATHYEDEEGNLVRANVPHIGDPFHALEPNQRILEGHTYTFPSAHFDETGAETTVAHEAGHEVSISIANFISNAYYSTPGNIYSKILTMAREAGYYDTTPSHQDVEALKNSSVMVRFSLEDNEEALNYYEDWVTSPNEAMRKQALNYLQNTRNRIEAKYEYHGEQFNAYSEILEAVKVELPVGAEEYLSDWRNQPAGLRPHNTYDDPIWDDYYDRFFNTITMQVGTSKQREVKLAASFLDAKYQMDIHSNKLNYAEVERISFQSVPEMWKWQMKVVEFLDQNNIKIDPLGYDGP